MGKVEVLVSTLAQKNLNLIKKMNIQSDVFIANQDDRYHYEEKSIDGKVIRMLTTPERGVGRNRNKGLLYAKGEILLFADDDMIYQDGYEQEIIKAYEQLPKADVIIFGAYLTKNGKVYQTVKNKTKRLSLFESMRYGTCVLSIKKESWLRANIYFSHLFGGGCPYGSGEDSLFIRDCFQKKLKVYSYEYILGFCAKDSSTWFKGYNKKYFYDTGILYASLFPKLPRMMCIQFILRHRDLIDNNIPYMKALKSMFSGVRDWRKRKKRISDWEG